MIKIQRTNSEILVSKRFSDKEIVLSVNIDYAKKSFSIRPHGVLSDEVLDWAKYPKHSVEEIIMTAELFKDAADQAIKLLSNDPSNLVT